MRGAHAVTWLKLDLKWVMKQELRKLPAIGIGCEKAGHIFIDRRNPQQAAKAITEALERLGTGIGILFFPEGTRSPDGHLLTFKKGAFRTAIDQQMPLLPVTLVGTRDILPARTLRLCPGKARMVIHPPIETEGLTVDDYLERSGGPTRQADEDRVYVVKADGSVMLPEKSRWFGGRSQQLSPGDTVIVPIDVDRLNQLELWTNVSQIVYQIALGAAAVGNL